MDFALKPSLQLIAIAKLTIILWEKHSRIHYKEFRYFSELDDFWHFVYCEVGDVIDKIQLPESLKSTVIKFYKTVSMEMLIWVQLHVLFISYDDIDRIRPHCIKWTLVGTIDKKSTAETLVNNRDICVKSRYMLACYYCLESWIPVLYKNLSEMNDSNDSNWRESVERSDVVIKYWTHKMRKKNTCYCSNCRKIFKRAAIRGNKIATEYFFKNMAIDTRKHSLVNIAIKVVREGSLTTKKVNFKGRDHYSEVLFFFITQMNTDQLQQLLQSKVYLSDILACFLEWPMHVHFMDMVNLSWEYFDKTNYIDLLNDIIYREKIGNEDYDYRELFKEFWEQSPDRYKKYLGEADFEDFEIPDHHFEILDYLEEINDEMDVNILLDYSPP